VSSRRDVATRLAESSGLARGFRYADCGRPCAHSVRFPADWWASGARSTANAFANNSPGSSWTDLDDRAG
jgi:hypothetical protein